MRRHVSKVPEPEVAHFLAVSFAKGTHECHLSTERPALFAARRCSPREQPTANRVTDLRHGRPQRRSYGTTLHLRNSRNETACESFSGLEEVPNDVSGHRRRVCVRLAQLLAAPQR